MIESADVLQARSPDADGETTADIINQGSEYLLRTLDSVLDLLRLESGTFRLSCQSFKLAKLVRNSASHLRHWIRSSDISLDV
jgi:signal transduction histidine kinase